MWGGTVFRFIICLPRWLASFNCQWTSYQGRVLPRVLAAPLVNLYGLIFIITFLTNSFIIGIYYFLIVENFYAMLEIIFYVLVFWSKFVKTSFNWSHAWCCDHFFWQGVPGSIIWIQSYVCILLISVFFCILASLRLWSHKNYLIWILDIFMASTKDT